ncbi:hypothetical protein HYD_4230 [Candidatus Hydrogenosomobacter endosymbioticus]|uniref:N-acetylmuramoyl-L-alanine amidase n=2 Tax=Candidatus Hydrogenosomobacter endosymbioticus TaxID=2558174 RepID=A0ABM7V918_9PROT|nr:hypothetical protein HYD_4230 [Candidatus Hydrogenosomobacter endosymbioticus]
MKNPANEQPRSPGEHLYQKKDLEQLENDTLSQKNQKSKEMTQKTNLISKFFHPLFQIQELKNYPAVINDCATLDFISGNWAEFLEFLNISEDRFLSDPSTLNEVIDLKYKDKKLIGEQIRNKFSNIWKFYRAVPKSYQLSDSSYGFDTLTVFSPNFSPNIENSCKALIAHCMGLDVYSALSQLTKKTETQVSAHYFIPYCNAASIIVLYPELQNIDGIGSSWNIDKLKFPFSPPVFHILPEEKKTALEKTKLSTETLYTESFQRAWHAGKSEFSLSRKVDGCDSGMNTCSIGIESQSPGYGARFGLIDFDTFSNFSVQQISTFAKLVNSLQKKFPNIKILSHQDIAPERKTDPGINFPWRLLHEKHGIGYLPSGDVDAIEFSNFLEKICSANSLIEAIQSQLKRIGYSSIQISGELDSLTKQIIKAFLRHFGAQSTDIPFENYATDPELHILSLATDQNLNETKAKIAPMLKKLLSFDADSVKIE